MQKALAAIIDYAVYIAKPEKVLLFGSYARGDNNVYSDIDLLVITRHNYMKKEMENQIILYAREFSLRADVFIHTPDDIKNAMKKPLSFLSFIIRNGKSVYEIPTVQ